METNVANFLFKEIGIDKVIWIDDNFSQNSTDETEKSKTIDLIVNQIQAILDTGNTQVLETIDGLDIRLPDNKPNDVILSDLREHLYSTDINLSMILNQLDTNHARELTQKDIQNIENTLKRSFELEEMSLFEWQTQKNELLNQTDNKLFLIDKEFKHEGGTEDDGINIIKEILLKNSTNTNPPICILFTHTCRDTEQEENTRKGIYSKLQESITGLPSYCFQVLSKSRIAELESSGKNLINALKALLVRRTFTKMAYGLKNNLNKNISNVTDLLINSNIHELEEVIFGSTNKEGVSELELLDRIYHLNQRKVLSELISTTPDIIEDIIKLRYIRGKLPSNPDTTSSYSEFIAMRQKEVWTPQDIINKIHMPISNGDIFKINKKEYILIAQPCEISIRRNGKRKTDIAILAPISNKNSDQIIAEADNLKSGICYAFSEHAKDNSQWYVEFNSSFYININVLDLCTFNEQGKVFFSNLSPKPRILDIGGQGKRFDALLRLSKESPQLIPTELKVEPKDIMANRPINRDFIVNYIPEENKWVSEIERIRRLEDPFAEYVLNKYFLYRSRKAFEHDFTLTH